MGRLVTQLNILYDALKARLIDVNRENVRFPGLRGDCLSKISFLNMV